MKFAELLEEQQTRLYKLVSAIYIGQAGVLRMVTDNYEAIYDIALKLCSGKRLMLVSEYMFLLDDITIRKFVLDGDV